MAETRKFQLTQHAYDRLKEELAFLEGEAREKIINDIATARAHVYLIDNAEYHAAKDQQGFQEARVRQIREMIDNAEIIQADDDGLVRPGKLVTIPHEGEEPETYLLGSREEKRAEHLVLTPDSPLGQALMGRSAGETVVARAPAGEMNVEIVEVRTL